MTISKDPWFALRLLTVDVASSFAEIGKSMALATTALVEAFRPLVGDLSNHGLLRQMPSADYERLARQVAAAYNCTHPARKLSWRRLNRPQRHEVVRLWLEEKR